MRWCPIGRIKQSQNLIVGYVLTIEMGRFNCAARFNNGIKHVEYVKSLIVRNNFCAALNRIGNFALFAMIAMISLKPYLYWMNIDVLKFDPETGLIPAIIQDNQTGRVLMLGYMNRESIHKTLDSGLVTFFSRSRSELWTKGESSGNFLHFVSMADDCDNDALLIQARPQGATCHTGKTSCFEAGQSSAIPDSGLPFLGHLEAFLQERKRTMPEGSYTSKMFDKGLDKIAQKVGEEAVETVIAAKNDDEKEFVYEASDLLFHLILLMVQKEIPLQRLIEELRRRHS